MRCSKPTKGLILLRILMPHPTFCLTLCKWFLQVRNWSIVRPRHFVLPTCCNVKPFTFNEIFPANVAILCQESITIKSVFSEAPTRASGVWDRAPYPEIMVNLFSFGCHMIDRAYVGVYGLYGWGRGDYQKEGRGVSGVSCQVHIFYIRHSQYGQLTAVKTG